MEIVGDITDEAVSKYTKAQAEESRKEDSRGTALQRTSNGACDTPFGESSKIALLGANGKPPVERVVADLDNGTYRQPHEPVYGHLSGQTQTENQTYE